MHINGLRIVKGCRPYLHQPAELPEVGDCEPCDSDGQREFEFDDCEEVMAPEPTHHRPGSCEKIDVLADRFERGQPLFVDGDANVFSGAVIEELI